MPINGPRPRPGGPGEVNLGMYHDPPRDNPRNIPSGVGFAGGGLPGFREFWDKHSPPFFGGQGQRPPGMARGGPVRRRRPQDQAPQAPANARALDELNYADMPLGGPIAGPGPMTSTVLNDLRTPEMKRAHYADMPLGGPMARGGPVMPLGYTPIGSDPVARRKYSSKRVGYAEGGEIENPEFYRPQELQKLDTLQDQGYVDPNLQREMAARTGSWETGFAEGGGVDAPPAGPDIEGYMQGANALPPEELDGVLQQIVQLDPNQSEDAVNLTAIVQAAQSGDMERASAILAGFRKRFDSLNAHAQGAAAHGDLAAAAQLAGKAHSQVPDGMQVSYAVGPDGNSVTATVTPSGQTFQLDGQQFHDYLVGPATSFDHILENGLVKNLTIASGQRGGQPAPLQNPAPTGYAAGGRVESTQDIIDRRQEQLLEGPGRSTEYAGEPLAGFTTDAGNFDINDSELKSSLNYGSYAEGGVVEEQSYGTYQPDPIGFQSQEEDRIRQRAEELARQQAEISRQQAQAEQASQPQQTVKDVLAHTRSRYNLTGAEDRPFSGANIPAARGDLERAIPTPAATGYYGTEEPEVGTAARTLAGVGQDAGTAAVDADSPVGTRARSMAGAGQDAGAAIDESEVGARARTMAGAGQDAGATADDNLGAGARTLADAGTDAGTAAGVGARAVAGAGQDAVGVPRPDSRRTDTQGRPLGPRVGEAVPAAAAAEPLQRYDTEGRPIGGVSGRSGGPERQVPRPQVRPQTPVAANVAPGVGPVIPQLARPGQQLRGSSANLSSYPGASIGPDGIIRAAPVAGTISNRGLSRNVQFLQPTPNTGGTEFMQTPREIDPRERLGGGGRRVMSADDTPKGYTAKPDEDKGWIAVPNNVAPGTKSTTMYTADGTPVTMNAPSYWNPDKIRYGRHGSFDSGPQLYQHPPGTQFDQSGQPIPGTGTPKPGATPVETGQVGGHDYRPYASEDANWTPPRGPNAAGPPPPASNQSPAAQAERMHPSAAGAATQPAVYDKRGNLIKPEQPAPRVQAQTELEKQASAERKVDTATQGKVDVAKQRDDTRLTIARELETGRNARAGDRHQDRIDNLNWLKDKTTMELENKLFNEGSQQIMTTVRRKLDTGEPLTRPEQEHYTYLLGETRLRGMPTPRAYDGTQPAASVRNQPAATNGANPAASAVTTKGAEGGSTAPDGTSKPGHRWTNNWGGGWIKE